MRVNIVGQGGYSSAGLSITGAILTGPLTLSRDPVQPLEATTKRYVDLAANSLDASKVTTGTLATARLPAFTGDLTSTQGNNILTLGNTGVTPGTYTKLTVDAKGRTTAATNLTAGDIPALSWSKITSGKPTTLAGYGITNGVSINGDNVTGYVTAHADPVSGLQLATKQYVDGKAGTGTIVPTGGTIQRTNTTTPSGYLRANGALVSKTAYPDLYAMIGDNVTIAGNTMAGSGRPWEQQYQFNTSQSAAVSGWTTADALPVQLTDSTPVVTKNKVYLLGGGDPVSVLHSNRRHSATINSDGTLSAWSVDPVLPFYCGWGSRAVITKNRVYVVGVLNVNGEATNQVYTAPINLDGTFGAWTLASAFPVSAGHMGLFVTSSRVYSLGGADGNGVSANIYTATFDASGVLGTWSSAGTLPAATGNSALFVTKDRVYLVGGWTTGWDFTSAIYTAPINADGTLGSWSSAGTFPVTVADMRLVVTKNRAYTFGGYDAWDNLNVTYTAPVNADGTLGTWTSAPPLPAVKVSSAVFVTSSRIYLAGGTDGDPHSSVYVAPFSGGLNDYSAIYSGGYQSTDPNNFRLPDTTLTDPSGLYSFIKY